MAGMYANALLDRLHRDRAIQQPAVDDVRLDGGRRVSNLETRRREESGGGKRIEDCAARQPELAKRIVGEDAGAVDRSSDFIVLLEQGDGEAGPGEEGCGVQSSGTASYNRSVQHLRWLTPR